MARCSGCSKVFPLLPNGRRCGACVRRAAGEVYWNQCVQCGNPYEFLDAPFICATCEDYDGPGGTAEVAEEALSRRVNPRTYSTHRSTTPVARSTRPADDSEEDEALQDHATQVINAMAGSHGRAVARAAPGVKVAPPKIKGAQAPTAPPKKPAQRISVRLDKIVNLATGKRTPPPPGFLCARIHEMPDDTPMSDVIEWMRTVVDAECTKAHGQRIYKADDLLIMWAASKTQVDGDTFLALETLGALWKAASSNPNFVKPADKKINRLDFYVNVKYTVRGDEDGDSDVSAPNAVSRKSGSKKTNMQDYETEAQTRSSVTRPKRPRLSANGSTAYQTEVASSMGIAYEVEKSHLARLDERDPTRITWITSSTRKQAIVENDYFAFGKTKHVYKLLMNGTTYAAKCFYDVGKGVSAGVSIEENQKHLQDELLRQFVAKESASSFMDAAQANNVSVYTLTVEDAFLLRVVKGSQKGHCWITDSLYDDAELAMCKFSGTDEAGHNNGDLVGRTCDAWAHYSFYDSQGTLVFVDIQGIDTALLPMSSRRNKRSDGMRLILFDLMIHSEDKRFGLGDKGKAGLLAFAEQHVCNSICKELGLPEIDVQKGGDESDPGSGSAPSTNVSQTEQDPNESLSKRKKVGGGLGIDYGSDTSSP